LPGQLKGSGRPASINVVSADFFATLKIPMLRGCAFQQSDVTPDKPGSVIIVSEAFARTFWPVRTRWGS
jgi:hypothetical protein